MIRFDNHAFKGLDASLKRLYELVASMGTGVEQMVSMLPQALEVANHDVFAQAKSIDKTINSAELEVDATVAAIINKFTIMAEDLRFVLGSIKFAGTLERAADKIKNCAKRLAKVHHPLDNVIKEQLSLALGAVHAMVPLAMDQVLDYNPDAAQELLRYGATVQSAYRAIVVRLHDHEGAADDETHVLLVAKNLDQAADMIIEIMKISHYVHFAAKYEKISA